MFDSFFLDNEALTRFAKSKRIVISQLTPLHGGLINALYKMRMNGKECVLRIYVRHKPKKDIAFELDVMDYLNENGLPVPKIYSLNGEKIFQINGKNAIILEYKKGKMITGKKLNVKKVIALARLIGLLHFFGKSYRSNQKRNETDLFDFSYDSRFEKRYLGKITEKYGFSNIELLSAFIRDETKSIFSLLCNYKKKSHVLIHNDARLVNVIFSGDKVNALIDFDECCFGNPDSDIATLIGNIPRNHQKIFIKKYESYAKRNVDLTKIFTLAYHYRLLLLKWAISQYLKSQKSGDISTFKGYLDQYSQFNQLKKKFPSIKELLPLLKNGL